MKKHVKKVVSALVAATLMLSLAACGGKSDSGSSSDGGDSKDKVKIVVMPKVVGIDYYNAVQKGVDQASEELADVAEITWQGPTEGTVDKQIEMLETIIPTKPDVICIAANDPDAIQPTLEKAQKEGIKVVSWDADANVRDIFVNLVDYTVFGNAVIDSLASQIGEEGEVAIITTTFTATNQVLWIEAIEARIAEKYPNIKIVDTREAGEDTQKANTLASDLMKTYPDLKGIIALGAPNLPGAVDAVVSANKTGQVIVAGNSTPNTMKPYLEDGSIRDVQLWSAPDHGYLTVYTAYQLATEGVEEGKAFSAGQMGEFTPEKDEISISIGLPLVEFTKDNVGDYDF
ncbi:MAG: substrate-binding domain-containing protein [Coprococcus sp.]|nr:substrate-binding domain-containing protein [Coprococcus sp.]